MLRATALSERPLRIKNALISLVVIAYSPPLSRFVTGRDGTRIVASRQQESLQSVTVASSLDTFGGRLREAFGGLTNAQIAQKLHVSKSAITNYIQGRIPPPETLEAISRLTNCSLHWLITGAGAQFVNGSEAGTLLHPGEVPICFGEKEQEIIRELAAKENRTFSEQARELVLESLKVRGLIKDQVEHSNLIFFGAEPELVTMMLLGEVAAGLPLHMFSDPEQVQVPQDFERKGRETFVLRVVGESMIDDGIRDGDLIICEARNTARRGETVIAIIDGERATVKHYFPEHGRIRLQPANDLHEPIFLTEDRIKIQGVVVGLYRRSRFKA